MLGSLLRVLCAVCVSLSVVAIQPWSAVGATDVVVAQAAAPVLEEAVAGADPTRIVLYGDSLTMGFSGDWTWRYRLWRSLTASETAFDFVGPRTDVLTYATQRQFSQAYRDPEFDRDHASYGGMTFTNSLWQPSALANYYKPDVMVGLVGMNDMLQRLRTPAQLVEMWRIQIARVRYWRPQASVVLVQLPETWWSAVRAYNAGLAALAKELDLPGSRVITTADAHLDPYTDTYDYMHPSATGERKMADAVATALASIGIGNGPVADLVDQQSSVVWAPTPVATVVSGTLTVSWPAVDYALKQDVYVEDITVGLSVADPSPPTRVTGTTWSMPAEPGHTYRVSLSPVKGFLPMGTHSAPVVAVAPELVDVP